MLTSWFRAQINSRFPQQCDQESAKVPCPESPKLPAGMSQEGIGKDRIIEGDLEENEDVSLLDLFPTNPSVALHHLTPILPAADNKAALACVISLQALFGLTLLCRRIPKFGELAFRTYSTMAARKITGLLLVTSSAIESLRFPLPYDPWVEEAREWRNWAIRNGDNPSWWFGAIEWYEPMSYGYWIELLRRRLDNERLAKKREARLEQDETRKFNISLNPDGTGKDVEFKFALPSWSHQHQFYPELKLNNRANFTELLNGPLKDVNELNKAERIDAALEQDIKQKKEKGASEFDFDEPEMIHLPVGITKKKWESDDNLFTLAWTRCEPWWELAQGLSMEVRLVPSSKNVVISDE